MPSTKKGKLTVKQEKFITSYVQTGNATQSAIDAGYSSKTARQIANINLTKADIKARRAELEAQINSPKIADAEEIRRVLTDIIRDEHKIPVTATDKVKATAELSKLGGYYAPEKKAIIGELIIRIVDDDDNFGSNSP